MPPHRSWWQRLRRPQSGLGPGLKNWVLETFPPLLHCIPDRWRLPFVKSHLGPKGAWWLRDKIVGQVPISARTTVVGACPLGERLQLRLRAGDGSERLLVCDHLIAGTGFVVDIDRLTFVDADLQRNIRRLEKGPALDRRFQSSVPGLYFVGFASSLSFGPLFRFVAGARFTARAVSHALGRQVAAPSPIAFVSSEERVRASR
jgi:hypothetical protein